MHGFISICVPALEEYHLSTQACDCVKGELRITGIRGSRMCRLGVIRGYVRVGTC